MYSTLNTTFENNFRPQAESTQYWRIQITTLSLKIRDRVAFQSLKRSVVVGLRLSP